MSYVDGNSGTSARRKAFAGGAVALIQVGLALALVNGLAISFLAPDKPRNLPTRLFPTTPMTPPPTVEQRSEQPLRKDTPVDAPPRKIALDPQPTFTGVAIDPLPLGGGLETGTDAGPPLVRPSEPPARFAPKIARPRGDLTRWVTTQDYPSVDLRAGNSGTVRFRLAIDGAGRVTGCTVTQSSGHPGLDAATCRNVARRARFDAASDAAGEKVAGTYDGTIRWVIPQD